VVDTPFPLGGRPLKLEASRLFPLTTPDVPLRTVQWPLYGGVLNQGHWWNPHIGKYVALGSCTGHGKATLLNCRPHHQRGIRFTDDHAVSFYAAGTREDPFPGFYDPVVNHEDTGGSMITVLRIAKRSGLIASWENIFTRALGIAQALQRGPVIVATPWLRDMFWPQRDPDRGHYLRVSGREEGWHCYVINRYHHAKSVDNRWFGIPQTWGVDYGLRGHVRVGWHGLQQLMDEGEAALAQPR
jgi:hypothetical protein